MKKYKITCSHETHHIGLDSEGNVHLLNHDIEEQETFEAFGEEISNCYKVVRDLEDDAYQVLLDASMAGYLPLVELAVDYADFTTRQLSRALSDAATFDDDVEIVKYLHEAGGNVNHHQGEPIVMASANSNVLVVEYLIANGAHVGARCNEAIAYAAGAGCEQIVKMLIDAGADVHETRERALVKAVKYGHTAVVRLLLDAGADVGDSHDTRLLQMALENQNADIVRLLLTAGVEIGNAKDYVLRCKGKVHPEDVADTFCQAGIDPRTIGIEL